MVLLWHAYVEFTDTPLTCFLAAFSQLQAYSCGLVSCPEAFLEFHSGTQYLKKYKNLHFADRKHGCSV